MEKSQPITHCQVFYLKSSPVINGEMKMELKNKFIPIELRDEFLETFKNNTTPTEEEINKFLEDNNG